LLNRGAILEGFPCTGGELEDGAELLPELAGAVLGAAQPGTVRIFV